MVTPNVPILCKLIWLIKKHFTIRCKLLSCLKVLFRDGLHKAWKYVIYRQLIFPSWFYWLGEESCKSEFCSQLSRDSKEHWFQKGNVLQPSDTRASPQHVICLSRPGLVFILFYPSIFRHSSSFLLNANPVVWRPTHGSDSVSYLEMLGCGQPRWEGLGLAASLQAVYSEDHLCWFKLGSLEVSCG